MNPFIEISKEVRLAIKESKPIVALESTIICHGMPYPQNYEMAINIMNLVKNANVTPATIAIINGIPKIGLSEEEIHYLSKQGKSVTKVSKRDIPYVLTKKLDGATTVSSTAYLASLANIEVFATGGIGGVHRGASTSFDISNDLEEISNTNIIVVCSGAKSILDLNATVEYLETKGIELIGYQTDFLPAFYTNSSSIKVSHRLDRPYEIAKLMNYKNKMNIKNGIIVANPIPKQFSLEEQYINKAIDQAITEMNELNITGNKTTPFLLNRIKEITCGNSLDANIKLVINNAILAAEIAIELKKIKA